MRIILFSLYVGSVLAANLLTDNFGLHPLPFGLLVSAGSWTAGAALILRDALHEQAGRRWVASGIAVGAALSALTTSPALALASAAAFAASELADWAVYSRARRRSITAAVLLSSAIGAPIDTALFLWISPFPLTWEAMAGQMLVKIVLLAPLAVLLGRTIQRDVPR